MMATAHMPIFLFFCFCSGVSLLLPWGGGTSEAYRRTIVVMLVEGRGVVGSKHLPSRAVLAVVILLRSIMIDAGLRNACAWRRSARHARLCAGDC